MMNAVAVLICKTDECNAEDSLQFLARLSLQSRESRLYFVPTF
jgi:hypothetical protein